ncbi:MAG: WYL domain-containing protein [Anaerolineae bacterium]|nr:WYL domain-containing protein [Anaerolineae bacterium]
MGDLPDGSSRPEDLKRVARILEIVQMIATAPRRYLRRDLAKHFEVSERMIQKDLEIVRHGLVLSLEHDQGGYFFERMPRLPALQYSFSEALALLLAVQVAQQVTGIGSVELAAAKARLEALFPAEFTPFLRQRGQTMPVTAQGKHRQQMLTLLNRALVEGRKIQMVYATHSRGGEVNLRVVRPYALYVHVRSWHLIAYCERRESVLMFKVDRIHEARLLDSHYTIPPDFNVDDYMGGAWGAIRGVAGEAVPVTLRFTPEAGKRVSEEQWHASQRAEMDADGSILFRLHIAITPEFVNWVLYYGSSVEVLEPKALREQVAEEHRCAAEVNAGNP